MITELRRSRLAVLGTTGIVATTDPAHLAEATAVAMDSIAEIDRACSRFRADSDLTRVNEAAGDAVEVSPALLDAVEVALRAAWATAGDVDPTVGRAMRVLGYDRDFAAVPADGPEAVAPVVRVAPRWREIEIDRARGTLTIPSGVELDLGATAKALAADRAAGAASEVVGGGVLVSLGGDVAVAGPAPDGGWSIRIDDRQDAPLDGDGPSVSIATGGLATSGTRARRWRRGGVELHHVLDPKTGRPAEEVWRTVTVAAASCVDANIASTAAIIRGERAPEWLASLGLPARLVASDGAEVLVAGWGGPSTAEGVDR